MTDHMVDRVVDQMVEWNDHHGWGNGWGWVVMVVLMLLIVAVTVLLVRHFSGSASSGGTRFRSAGDVLADRFARGEIDEEEYRSRRDALRS
jgi:putative membrane protein